MKRIRLGNDINIAWSVFRNGQPEEFSGKELTLLMSNEYRTQELTDYEVHDHVISFAFCGKDQKSLGTYSLTLIENNGEEGMYTLDACDAFRLVARSCMEGGESSEGLSVETVQLSGDLAVPANGLSAYELAVKHGFVGTEQEWLASLKGADGKSFTYDDFTPEQIKELQKPATDAANELNELLENNNIVFEEETSEVPEVAEPILGNILTKTKQTLTASEKRISMNNIGANLIPINHLQWVTNAAETRKSVPADYRAKGFKISYTDSSKVYHVEQYIGDAFDDTSWASDSNWKGCRTPMTALFENIGAMFNDETGFYEYVVGRKTEVLTENEISDTYNLFYKFLHYYVSNSSCKLEPAGATKTSKVFVSPFWNYFMKYTLVCNNILSPNIRYFYINKTGEITIDQLFSNKQKLEYVEIISNGLNFNRGVFNQCVELKELFLKSIKGSFNTSSSPLINYESWKYIIDNSSNTSQITITVHPTTYSYLMGTAQPTEQVGGTSEEWQQIVADAAEKQITFATTE